MEKRGGGLGGSASKILTPSLFALLVLAAASLIVLVAPSAPSAQTRPAISWTAPSELSQDLQSYSQPKTITVTGEGEATAPPEKATVVLSVETFSESASKAVEDNFEAVSKVIKALEQAGVSKDDVETTSFSLVPVYSSPSYNGREQELIGYRCANSIKVTANEVAKLGHIIDISVAAGANRVSSVSFSLSSETANALKIQALRKAAGSAYSKALVIAEALKVSLKEPLKVETSVYIPPPVYYYASVRGFEPSIVPPRELSVSASVTITYGFE